MKGTSGTTAGLLRWLGNNFERILIGLFILPAVLTLVAVGLSARDQGAILDDVRSFLDQVRIGQTETAYTQLTSTRRSSVTQDEFRRLVAAHPQLRGWQTLRFPKLSTFGDSAARLTCVLEAASKDHVLTIGAQREAGRWRVDALRFSGAEAFLGSVPY